MMWEVLDTEKAGAQENMLIDQQLLNELQDGPVLHLYDWNTDSATIGYFIDLDQFLCRKGLSKHQIEIGRRPTGGGIVFHMTDLAFSALVPASCSGYSENTLENYAFINRRVSSVVKTFLGTSTMPTLLPDQQPVGSFCMAKPTKYDVMIGDRKVGGAAQRRTKKGFLHQGSISLGMACDDVLKDLLIDPKIAAEMKRNSYSLLGESWTKKQLQDAREIIRELLIKEFCEG